MHKHFITICLLLFIAYVFVTHQQNQKILTIGTAEPKYEFIEKVKTYVELFTADPKVMSLSDKDEPVLILIDPDEVDKSSKQKVITEQISPAKPMLNKEPVATSSAKKFVPEDPWQKKFYNVIYNVLHTRQGRELLEKILLNPREDTARNIHTQEANSYNNNSTIEVLQGEGASAGCGDVVTVNYTIRLVNGKEIENTRLANKPVTFQIGDGKVIKGLEYAIIGMKEGGLRRLVVPPSLAYIDEEFSQGLVGRNEFVTIDVELMSLKQSLKDWEDRIKIFQNFEGKRGHQILCSDEVYFTYKMTTSDEKIIINESNQVSFVMGSSKVPPAINKAFSGIKSESKRIVIIPASLLSSKISFLPANVKLPTRETIILEINTGMN